MAHELGHSLAGLDDLARYVKQTNPATVPAPGEPPLLPRPVFRAYDVGVAFNEDYVDLLYVTDRCLKSRNFINVIVAGKQPQLQWLDMEAAINHCTAGIGIWDWASNDQGGEPDVVMACAGDVPTLETLAAVSIIR